MKGKKVIYYWESSGESRQGSDGEDSVSHDVYFWVRSVKEWLLNTRL